LNEIFTNTKNIAIVCNNQAGKGKAVSITKHLQQKLQRLQIPFSVFENSAPENFDPFTSALIVGGDGTLNYFINQHPHISIPIALFKGGSGNDFAWKLYGDKTVDEYFEIVLNGSVKKVDAGICNGSRYGGGFMVAPQAFVDDGFLDIMLIKRIASFMRFFYVPKVEKGMHLNFDFVEAGKSKKVFIKSSEKVATHLDGEQMEANEFEIEILEGKFLFYC